ncbi:MAG: hypothetical protein K6U89_19120, partial [Chloroflexi bacterium]|nr:hypothetical protein [Chloroflexota bacterium]
MGSDYWTRRLTRRRVLRGTALGVIGLGLAACSTPAAGPTPAAPSTPAGGAAPTRVAGSPTPAARQPKRGGALKSMATFNWRTQDPHLTGGPAAGVGGMLAYSQLLTYKWGADIKPPAYIVTPDLAESWSQTDETTYVFKIRPNVKFHNIAPVNGRTLDAEDIKVSFERIIDKRAYAANLAGVTKIEAPDKTTLRLTLDRPNADLLSNLASPYMVILPKELADRDLTEGPTIGTGAWIQEAYEPGQRWAGRRNP